MSTRKLTVVQILPELNSGGVERGTLEIAEALVKQGHRSVVISAGGRLVPRLVAAGSEHITLPVHKKSFRTLATLLPLRRQLLALRPDVVHARSRLPAWLAWWALKLIPVPQRPHFITTVHGLNSVSRYSEIMTYGERVIAVSETVRTFILKHYRRCPPSRIRLIYRGVDPAAFPYNHTPSAEWLTQWQHDFPELTGKVVLALPGRVTRLKGHDVFLRLLGEVRQHHPQVHGLIVGGAESGKARYREELARTVDAMGLTRHVTFTGHRDDMRDVMSRCDLVFALSTKPETFGRAVLETLRLGRPVLGWDIGGVGEILHRIYPRGAVPSGDEKALLSTALSWLQQPSQPTPGHDFLLVEQCEQTLAVYAEVTADDPGSKAPERQSRSLER